MYRCKSDYLLRLCSSSTDLVGPIWSLADKYTVMGVKASVKLLTNTLKKTLSAFDLPD